MLNYVFVRVHTVNIYWGVETQLHEFSMTAPSGSHLYASVALSLRKNAAYPFIMGQCCSQTLWILWRRDKPLARDGNRKTIQWFYSSQPSFRTDWSIPPLSISRIPLESNCAAMNFQKVSQLLALTRKPRFTNLFKGPYDWIPYPVPVEPSPHPLTVFL